MTRPRVAFLCVHNSCRSQMAEAIGRLLASDVFESCSAGTHPAASVNPDAVRTVKTLYGADMAGQYPKLLAELGPVDIVVTMGCNVQCPTVPCRMREDWGLADPTGQGDEAFAATARAIEEKVRGLRARLQAQPAE